MNAHTRKTYQAIVGHPAPRDLEWNQFVTLWRDLADEVTEESGDRLAVSYEGHREVFHRPHNARVGIEDIERARHLLKAHPEPKGVGTVVAVTVDATSARIVEFSLDVADVASVDHTVHDSDPRAHHLRTVERHTGRDDVADLTGFYDELAAAIAKDVPGQHFVVLGHGKGKSDVAAAFVARLREHHHEQAELLAGEGAIDLSAADDADIEAAALAIVRGA